MSGQSIATADPMENEFRRDVIAGLRAERKFISSKYFYDATGDQIFQRIMAAPEYYLTNAENEILEQQSEDILKAISPELSTLDLVELGAGDGSKTKHLLRKAQSFGMQVRYRPVDISQHILDELEASVHDEFPKMEVDGIQGEYFKIFEGNKLASKEQKCILFLGSNIGNLGIDQAANLLRTMANSVTHKDVLFVGFDLKKDPSTILAAYNDSEGATRDFNLNLLHRINKELQATIDVTKFKHVPVYDPYAGKALSYVVATEDTQFTIDGEDEPFNLRAWEAIHLEVSQKYDLHNIRTIANSAGLVIDRTFTDAKQQYLNVLFKRNKE